MTPAVSPNVSPVQDFRQTALALVERMTARRQMKDFESIFSVRVAIAEENHEDMLIQRLAAIIPDNDLLWAVEKCGWNLDKSFGKDIWRHPAP